MERFNAARIVKSFRSITCADNPGGEPANRDDDAIWPRNLE